MTIRLTESAVKRVKEHILAEPSSIGLRLGVKASGCSGLSYVLDYAKEVADNDVVFEEQGVRLVIDDKSLPFLDGTEVDFVSEGLNRIFKFRNPQAKAECGCGESFTT